MISNIQNFRQQLEGLGPDAELVAFSDLGWVDRLSLQPPGTKELTEAKEKEVLETTDLFHCLSDAEKESVTPWMVRRAKGLLSPEASEQIRRARSKIQGNETVPHRILLAAHIARTEQGITSFSTPIISAVLNSLGVPTNTISTNINSMLDAKNIPLIAKPSGSESEAEKAERKTFVIAQGGETVLKGLLH